MITEKSSSNKNLKIYEVCKGARIYGLLFILIYCFGVFIAFNIGYALYKEFDDWFSFLAMILTCGIFFLPSLLNAFHHYTFKIILDNNNQIIFKTCFQSVSYPISSLKKIENLPCTFEALKLYFETETITFPCFGMVNAQKNPFLMKDLMKQVFKDQPIIEDTSLEGVFYPFFYDVFFKPNITLAELLLCGGLFVIFNLIATGIVAVTDIADTMGFFSSLIYQLSVIILYLFLFSKFGKRKYTYKKALNFFKYAPYMIGALIIIKILMASGLSRF